MHKVMEEYEDIFASLTEVPLHCQDKHSIDLTPDAPSPDVAIPLATTHTESTHVLSEADKETKITKCIQHVRPQVHDIFEKYNTQFNRICLISWRISMQWGPFLPKEEGMIQVDIGGHPPIPFVPTPSFLAAFHFHRNLLFLGGCRFLNFQSYLEALMSHMDIDGHPPIPFRPAPSVLSFFQFRHNLLLLVNFRVLNLWSHFEALNDVPK